MNKYLKLLSVSMIAALSLMILGCDDSAEEESITPALAKQSRSAEQMLSNETFPSFTTSDLGGNQVSNNIFANKKLTVVNIWGTFCPPCIAEMPDLGRWAREMPADVQLIGIVCDVEDSGDSITIAEAQNILDEANAKFINLIPDNNIMRYLERIEAVPTTIFVDSEGRILTETVVGADMDSYKQIVEEYLGE